jgi:hypothetical protein
VTSSSAGSKKIAHLRAAPPFQNCTRLFATFGRISRSSEERSGRVGYRRCVAADPDCFAAGASVDLIDQPADPREGFTGLGNIHDEHGLQRICR